MDNLARAFPSLIRIDLAREADFALGTLLVRPSRCEVEGAGGRHTLQRRVMQVLVALAHPLAEVVSHEELIRRCWGGLAVGEDAVGRCIGQLRRFAAQWPEPPFEIETIAGVGYRLSAAAGPAPAIAEAPRRRWPVRTLAIAVAAVAVASAAGGYVWFDRTGGEARAIRSPTIAVLAFQPTDTGGDARLLAEGLARSLASALSRYDVTVIAASSSLQLSPAQKPHAGSLLGADFVIDGHVLSDHGKLTVSTQISDARKNVIVYSFDVQGDSALSSVLADRIATHLALTLDPSKFMIDATRRFTASDYVLLARENDAIDKGDMLGAMDASRRLAERYPDDGELQADAGVPIIFATSLLPESQRSQFLRTARAEIERGTQLAPKSGLVYFARSNLVHGPMSLIPQERLLRRSMQLNPTFAPTYNAIGGVMLMVGRIDEGVALLQRSVQFDPLSDLVNGDAVLEYIEAGRGWEASQAMARQETMWPNSEWFPDLRYRMATYLGTPQDEIAVGKKYPRQYRLAKSKSDADLLLQAEITRDRTLIRKAIGNCFETFGTGPSRDETCLFMMVRMGALDEAFKFAELAYPDVRNLYPPEDDRWLTAPPPSLDTTRLFAPTMAPFRDDPRFWSVALRAGLVDYWRTTQAWPDFCRDRLDTCKSRAAQSAKDSPTIRTAARN
jgi:DNA-binding winged helix-turn-helix (wHTH) protein/TolB-like protein